MSQAATKPNSSTLPAEISNRSLEVLLFDSSVEKLKYLISSLMHFLMRYEGNRCLQITTVHMNDFVNYFFFLILISCVCTQLISL